MKRLIEEIKRDGGNLKKPMKRFGVWMDGQVLKTFRDEGRGPVKWKPLAAVTMIFRKLRGRGARGKILQVSGALKRSVRDEVRQKSGDFVYRQFMKAPYAGTHQFGGTMKIPARTIVPKKPGGVLVFEIDGKTIFARRVNQPARTAKVPKREMIFFLGSDITKATNILEQHAGEIAARKGRRF